MSNSDVNRAGHCPVCRACMSISDDGEFVVCPKGDYEARFEDWDLIWVHFDIAKDDADELVKDLLELNLVEDAA